MTSQKRIYRKCDLEQKLEVIRLYQLGYGSGFISKELNINDRYVLRLISRHRECGVPGLKKQSYTKLSADQKANLVRQVLEESLSCETVALKNGVSESALHCWVTKVKESSFESLAHVKQRGRPSKNMGRPKKKEPQGEVEKLQEELAYLKAENAYLKKVRALVEERIARESGKSSKPSKN